MGCDGGTIPTRDELVRTKKKPEQKDKDSVRLYKWQHCALTQEVLSKRIVACQLGRMYKKEAVIERMLETSANKDSSSSSNGASPISHIQSLKDIKDLDLTPNPSFNSAKNTSVGDNYVDRYVSPWICPITGLEMNGRFKFVFDWSTGRVLSERAHKMVRNDDAARIDEENVVVLNPEEGDEADLMRTKMEARQARAKAEKKAKKEAKRKAAAEAASTSDAKSAPEFKVPAAAAAAAKNGALADGATAPKKSKTEVAEKSKKSSSSSAASSVLGKMKSVQKDASKSEVYKSLFSSHASAQNKPKNNWVTFDPRYN